MELLVSNNLAFFNSSIITINQVFLFDESFLSTLLINNPVIRSFCSSKINFCLWIFDDFKMRINKKIILLIIIPVFALISGCNSEGMADDLATGTPLVTATSISTATPEISPEEIRIDLPSEIEYGQNIIFWHAWPGRMANLMEEFALEYNSENQWNTEILVEAHADQRILYQDLADLNEEDQTPDMIAAPGYILRAMEEMGMSLMDLSLYIESDGWALFEDGSNNFYPNFWSEDIYSGKRLGVPVYRTAYFLFYNRSFAEDLGFDEVPVSVEAYREQICSATQALALQGIGGVGWIYNYNAGTMLSWMHAFGGGLEINDQIKLLSSENINSLGYLFEIFHENGCTRILSIPEPAEYFFK